MKCSATSREILETSSGKNERKKKEMTENKRNEEESSLVERNLSAMTERNHDRKKRRRGWKCRYDCNWVTIRVVKRWAETDRPTNPQKRFI